MVGHFLDELLPVDQAVGVREIMDHAGTVKPIFLALLSQGGSCFLGSCCQGLDRDPGQAALWGVASLVYASGQGE